jgi:hypothetical protein
MSNKNITLIKLDTVHLYLNLNKKIIFFDVIQYYNILKIFGYSQKNKMLNII